MLDLHKLNQFVTLARTGSYVRAAEALHLSQSALTRNIQALERQYHVKLVERQRGRIGINLTKEGHVVLRRAQDLLRRAQEIEEELHEVTVGPAQRIAFGIGPMLAGVLLGGEIGPRIAQDRHSEVDIVMESPGIMMDKLLAGEIDFYLGLGAGPGSVPARVAQELLGVAFARIWVRAGHPLTELSAVSLADLAPYTLVSGHAWNQNIVPFIEDESVRSLFTVSVQIDNYELLKGIALESDGILLSAFGDPAGRLVGLEIVDGLLLPPSQLYVFTIAGIELTPAAASIREMLASAYRDLTTA